MANPARLREAFTAAIASATLDEAAPREPRDERIAFDRVVLDDAMRLLEGPADRERAIEMLDELMRAGIATTDLRQALASLLLMDKLGAAERRVLRETENGFELS